MKSEMNGYDEEQIAQLLRLFPAAPQAWVQAAQELPAARAALDELTARAERDAAFVAQANAFLDSTEGRAPVLCSLDEGAQTLRVNLAILERVEQKSWQTIAREQMSPIVQR